MKVRFGIVAASMAAIVLLAGCAAVNESENTAQQFDMAVESLQVEAPTPRSPLQMKASLIPAQAAPGETVKLVVKVRLMPGWHFYDYVPPTEPYIQTKWLMELGSGLESQGEWGGPEATPYISNPMMLVHEGGAEPMVFYRELVVSENATGAVAVEAGLHFQACDADICLPARKRTEDLILTVIAR